MNPYRPAERLLRNLGITEPREIDLEAIAFDQGAAIKYRHLTGCEARIIGYGDKAIITVDDRNQPSRMRFSIAHELGHWSHHRGRSLACRSEDIGDPGRKITDPERVADSYAADLLLPRYIFAPYADKLARTSFDSIHQLAEEFSTSITATAIRMVEFGPEPAILVCHGKEGRRWFFRPRDIPEKWFPRKELDADSYAMDVLYGGLSKSRRVLMDADTWFDVRHADQFQIFEESMNIGRNEILTLLILKDAEMLDDDA